MNKDHDDDYFRSTLGCLLHIVSEDSREIHVSHGMMQKNLSIIERSDTSLYVCTEKVYSKENNS